MKSRAFRPRHKLLDATPPAPLPDASSLADLAPAPLPDAGPPARDALEPTPPGTAADLYGLAVGARWTYLRSGDVLRWKEITACEDVLLLDPTTGEHSVRRAYVRENRSVFGATSVHYLVVDETGVRRIRRDDLDEGDFAVFATYAPPSPRLHNGPHGVGDAVEFALRTAEWGPREVEPLGLAAGVPDEASNSASFRGASDTRVVDSVFTVEELTTIAGAFQVVGIERQWHANNPHNVRSYYAVGVGEVVEETRWPDTPVPQVEKLVAFTPGYGRCQPGPPPALVVPCAAPLLLCDDPWRTGVAGCTDPRVDPTNCGGCGAACSSGVCSGGRCLESECEIPCEGTAICCPAAWRWQEPGCTNPSRDRWNYAYPV